METARVRMQMLKEVGETVYVGTKGQFVEEDVSCFVSGSG